MAISKYENVSTAVTSGNRVESLKALADTLADKLDKTDSARETAGLAIQLIKTLEQIESLEPQKKESAVERRKREAAEKKAKEQSK